MPRLEFDDEQLAALERIHGDAQVAELLDTLPSAAPSRSYASGSAAGRPGFEPPTGMTRQGVQRVADQLVDRGLAEYRPNPAHRRAKLLACTEAGYWAIRQIALVQRPWADRIAAEIGAAELHETLDTVRRIAATLEAGGAQGN